MKSKTRCILILILLSMRLLMYGENSFRLPSIVELKWFPSGERLLFIVNQRENIKLVITTKKGDIITEIPKKVIKASISPDGDKVAYFVGPGSELWVLDMADLSEKKVASGRIRYFYWDKNGKNILYTKMNEKDQGLYVANVLTGSKTKIYSASLIK